jgi:hypothetical protein
MARKRPHKSKYKYKGLNLRLPPAPDALLWRYELACVQLGGIHRTTLLEIIKPGLLDQVKIGARHFVTRASGEAYVARQLQQQPKG